MMLRCLLLEGLMRRRWRCEGEVLEEVTEERQREREMEREMEKEHEDEEEYKWM